MNDFNYGQLSPNIREVVRWLRSMGWRWGWTGRDLLWVEQGGRGLRLRRAR